MLKFSGLMGLLLLLALRSLAQPAVFNGAGWITVPYAEDRVKRPCPVFELSFHAAKAVRTAKLYITALGLYEARINGKRVGDAYFTPGFTDYRERLAYQVYEVGALLKKDNRVSVLLGEGWYRGTFRNLYSDTLNNNFGKQGAVLAKLVITFVDGSSQTVLTDRSWRCHAGQLRYSELYDGEFWDTRSMGAAVYPVDLLSVPGLKLFRSVVPPVRKQERFPGRLPGNPGVFDFGQNLAGWVQLHVRGQAGDSLVVQHAEMLEKGDLYLGNLRSAKARDIYILKGGQQVLEPHFTCHGFRYARVSLYRHGRLTGLSSGILVSAVALYSDLKKTGSFACSDPAVNRLQRNIEWSLNSNFLEIPTDCPQRSERLAWTADAQVFCATASFLRDTKSFYEKWLADLVAGQGKNGAVPNFIPTSSPFMADVYGVTGWGDAAVIMPWTLYGVYGDKAALARKYASMKAWVDYMTSVSRDGLFQNKGYGDWYAMGPETEIGLIDQCFYAASAGILVEAAKVLGKENDAVHYAALLAGIGRAFKAAYRFGKPETSTQTAYVLALNFDVLPVGERQAAADSLAALIRRNGNKLATGFLGTPYLLPVLSRFGYSGLAYDLLLQRACPSWLYPVGTGATTIWERWDAVRPDGSLQECSYNHYAYGAVGQWLYEHVAGIRAVLPGYKAFVIAPEVDGPLTWAKAGYRCGYGVIRSAWKKQGRLLLLKVSVPAGTTAECRLKHFNKKLRPGNYCFRLPL